MLRCRCEALPIRFPRCSKLTELSKKEDEIAMKTACLIRHATINLSRSGLSDFPT